MAEYYMNDAMFDLPPAGFVDRTITYLEGTSPEGADVVLFVERQPAAADKTLEQAARQQVAEARRSRRRFEVMFDRLSHVGKLPAFEVGMWWSDAETTDPIYMRQAHIELGGTWLMFACEGPLREREFCDGCLEHVLGSLRVPA